MSVFNAGGKAAHEVVLRDEWPEETFDLVSGKYEENYASIEPQANESISFVVSPTEAGDFESARASVEYKYGEGDNRQETEGYSSGLGSMVILSAGDFEKKTALFVREWTLFGVLSAGPVLVPGVVWLYLQQQAAELKGKKA